MLITIADHSSHKDQDTYGEGNFIEDNIEDDIGDEDFGDEEFEDGVEHDVSDDGTLEGNAQFSPLLPDY